MVGGALAAVALLIAIIQEAVAMNRREFLQYLPPAPGATAVAFLSGVYLCLGAEFHWQPGEFPDNIALPVVAAALWWVFHNRMGKQRGRSK